MRDTAPPLRWSVRVWDGVQRLVALTALGAVSPVLGACMLMIRATGPGPVFFEQVRRGRGGRPITVRKLRTMRVGAERDARLQLGVTRGNPQVTAVGRVLRATKLDELPQLWSVATGEMALVGPRPIGDALDRHLRERISGFDQRYAVRPGLTSLGQVCVFDNFPEHRLLEDWAFRSACERHYVRNRGVRYDLVVLGLTVLLLGRKAAREVKVAPGSGRRRSGHNSGLIRLIRDKRRCEVQTSLRVDTGPAGTTRRSRRGSGRQAAEATATARAAGGDKEVSMSGTARASDARGGQANVPLVDVNRSERWAELQRLFLSRLEGVTEEMSAAIGSADLGRVRLLAHRLAGSSGMYGHAELSRLGRRCDDAARRGEPVEVVLRAANELLAEMRQMTAAQEPVGGMGSGTGRRDT